MVAAKSVGSIFNARCCASASEMETGGETACVPDGWDEVESEAASEFEGDCRSAGGGDCCARRGNDIAKQQKPQMSRRRISFVARSYAIDTLSSFLQLVAKTLARSCQQIHALLFDNFGIATLFRLAAADRQLDTSADSAHGPCDRLEPRKGCPLRSLGDPMFQDYTFSPLRSTPR